MGQRPTGKAGIPKPRYPSQETQRTFDAIIERLEVLDGIRGDVLDRAVTYRDLGDNGFKILGGAGGPYITGLPPDIGIGPGVGPPSGAPTNLTATDVFLALLLDWSQPSFNVAHIEVWRHTEENVSLATLIGSTATNKYVDYVGGDAAFWYWVRAVGTDGTASAFSNSAYGETSTDPSAFEFELNISASNLDAELAARIDLIDDPTTGLVTRVNAAEGDIVALDGRATALEANYTSSLGLINNNTSEIGANASLINTQQTSINQIISDLTDAEGNIIDNTTAIIANASDITNLEAAIGTLDPEGGEEWEFLTDLDGFIAQNASLTHSGAGTGSAIWAPSATDPRLLSPAGLSISGGVYNQVVMRVRKNVDGGTWEGNCYYSTAGHPFSASYVKTIPDPQMPLSQWTTLTWDMANLTSGGNDWIDSIITRLRFDLVSNDSGTYEIDWVMVAKFSTSAVAEALEALDVRVTLNEQGISAQGTRLTLLESTVDDPVTGVNANASALSALTTDVSNNLGNINANAAAITSLQSTVDDPTTGVDANASAISILETDISTLEGTTTTQASSITQLVASMDGAFGSIVNPLTVDGNAYGTTAPDSLIQAYNINIGGREGTALRMQTAGNLQYQILRGQTDLARIKVEPNSIYEVKVSLYHQRNNDAGSCYFGMFSYDTDYVSGNVAPTTGRQSISIVNNGALGSATSNPYWVHFRDGNHDEEWLDMTFYILGSDVDPALCPYGIVNGATTGFTGYNWIHDGVRLGANGPWVQLRVLNYNASPTYGDGTTTSLFVTDLQMRRVDSQAELHSALQVEASVRATETGDLNALYAVKAELNAGGDPYVTGFGLAADIINGQPTSAFGIRADQFFIQHPTATSEQAVPFGVGIVRDEDGNPVAQVGIRGDLIVSDTINATAIVAGTIGAREISVVDLNAIAVDTGTLLVDRLTTSKEGTATDSGGPYTNQSGWRVELESTIASTWPIWYGALQKNDPNGRFFVDNQGNVTVRGILESTLIKTSYFAPADSNYTFRIATQPNLWTAGNYTGKVAHFWAVKTTNWIDQSADIDGTDVFQSGIFSDQLTFYSPTYSGSQEYGRLGTFAESFICFFSATVAGASRTAISMVLQYKYDNDSWRNAFQVYTRTNDSTGMSHMHVFISASSGWDILRFRLKWFRPNTVPGGQTGNIPTLRSGSLCVMVPNFGYSDLALGTPSTGDTGSGEAAEYPDQPIRPWEFQP
jgi:hypothetical protein